MKKFNAIVLLLAVTVSLAAQRSKNVMASGEAFGSNIETVREEALRNAKRAALIEAGVQENITSLASVIIANGGSEVLQAENELSMIELDGRVTIKGEPQYEEGIVNGMVRIKAVIRASVVVEDAKDDPAFGLKVEGIRDVYRDGERMEFTVTPYGRDCYVRVFWFDGMPAERHDGAVLYPDEGGRYVDAAFRAGTSYLFPKLPATHSSGRPTKIAMRKQAEGPMEQCIIWVVALKRQVPYDVPCTYEDFLKWLLRIPASERVVRYQPVTILAQ